jgi:hypothetical protein
MLAMGTWTVFHWMKSWNYKLHKHLKDHKRGKIIMRGGIISSLNPPTVQELSRYDVNRKGEAEGFVQPLYDYQPYASVGQTSLTFFSEPIGQNGKTLADTNMESAGQMPSPKEQLVTGIQVVFLPGGNPGTFGVQTAANNWNDAYAVFKSGYLDFFIGSKSYLQDAPIGKFSNDFRLAGSAALSDASTAAADAQSMVDYATFAGPLYMISPVRLTSNQNFKVTLNWPAAVPLPSTVAARIGIILVGFQYRLSQ